MPELMEIMEDWKGFIPLSEKQRPEGYDKKLKETMDLLSNARGLAPHQQEFMIREALTTSDFPMLFGDVLDRQMLANYKAVAPVWKAFTKMSTVRRIFPQVGGYRFAMTGGDQYLEEVGQKGEYLASERNELRYQLSVKKRGKQFDISWESLINDDLGALQDTPMRFSTASVRTEHRITTGLYAGDVGAHVEGDGGFLYEAAINAFVDLLTIGNLEAALERMSSFYDINGEPILNQARYLVVPPRLEMTARQILTSASKMWVATGDTDIAAAPYPTTNVVAQMGLQLIIDPYLPIMNATDAHTQWYLFANPNDIAALEVAHLQGHEVPEICMKGSDKVSVTGAPMSPFSGNFATDNVFYRVRHIFGGTALDWRATYMAGAVNAIGN